MPTVRILNECHVPVPPGPYPAPGITVPLSFFDTIWISLRPVQRLFLYRNPDIPFATILQSLKSSLACILPFFHPFAGKLTYLPSSGDAVIDCSASAVGEGVLFIEAESDLDVSWLAGAETHDLESFVQLVPNIDVTELPVPVLAVQVTRFSGGGVAVGTAIHHVVSDGTGLWRFIESWAKACRSGGTPPDPTPVHDRAVIKYPDGNEIARLFMKTNSPDLPKTGAVEVPIEERLCLARRTFFIDAMTIKLLKQRAIDINPSTFVALGAHMWVSLIRAHRLTDERPVIAGFLANCRSRLDPPVSDSYTGNCVSYCFARSTGSELAGPDGFLCACTALKEAIREATEEPLAGCERWADKFLGLPKGRVVLLAGSPRFRAYDTDFGWGPPDRVELVSMNHDGEVVMLRGKEEGTVQVSVALSAQSMDEFTCLIAV